MRLPPPAPPEARSLASALDISLTAAALLHQRGFRDDDATRQFLAPKLAQLSSPERMADRATAARRIAAAVRARERITVFGDYDCDGITSAAIVTLVLQALGGTVTTLLASRFDGGYGFSERALERTLATKPSLLITCDCGSSDGVRLSRAAAVGIDPIVIDHHLVPPEPLPVLAFLNPCRPECGFPDKGLASCGLALSLAAAVRAELKSPIDLREYLDLVAIGTVADVAPLVGDNRRLVRAGLDQIARLKRPGLRALVRNAELNASFGITSEDVAFRIAPRLNAPGRLGSPDLALALLLEADPQRAEQIAAEVEQLQLLRRDVEAKVLASAREQVEALGLRGEPAIVVGGEGWHQGVVGIVAGRLAGQLKKPTIVVGFEGETGRGSVRGPKGFRLYDALGRCADTLVRFGGHQAAAGVELRIDQLEALRSRFAQACAQQSEPAAFDPSRDETTIDVLLHHEDDPVRVTADLARIEPFGEGNPAPRLGLEGVTVHDAREVRGGHLKLELEAGGRRFGGFGPNLGPVLASLGPRVHAAGVLRRDTYRGGDAVELRIDAIEPS